MQRLRPRSPGRGRPSTQALVAVGVVGLVVLPVVVATVRAVVDHWVPLGDDAYFSIRAADVWTARHFPLLGTWSSASLTLGRNVNNPGPLLFDALAVPVKLFGSAPGVAIGVGALNAAAIIGIGWIAHRRGGLMLLVPAMIVTAALGWTMGSELLFDPWQPHSMLLPFLCFLFLVWGMADGDLALVPWAVGVGSLLVQTHLSYAYLVPGLGLIGVLGLVWRMRRRIRSDGAAGSEPRRRIAHVGAVTTVVVVVCWLPPLIDQIAGVGNISALLDTGGGASGPTLGPTRAARVIASVLSLPPFWFRHSFADTLAPARGATGGPGGVGLAHMPSLPLALASSVLLVALLVASAVLARRQKDEAALTAIAIACFGLVAAYFTATRIPIELFGAAAHQFRFLWPLGAFLAFAILATLVRSVTRSSAPARNKTLVVAGAAVVAALSALTLPAYNAAVGPAMNLWAEPVVRDLDHQLAARPPKGPLLMDFSNIAFLEPYSTTLLAQLQRSGVGFVTDQAGQLRQIGSARRFNGHNARARVLYRLANGATSTPAGWRRIAFHPGLDRADRSELDRLEASGQRSRRRTDLERRWNRATIGVFLAPLRGPSARATP